MECGILEMRLFIKSFWLTSFVYVNLSYVHLGHNECMHGHSSPSPSAFFFLFPNTLPDRIIFNEKINTDISSFLLYMAGQSCLLSSDRHCSKIRDCDRIEMLTADSRFAIGYHVKAVGNRKINYIYK